MLSPALAHIILCLVSFNTMSTQASKNLDTFPNPHPDRDYTIRIRTPEFTCLCPKTGQPDFATLYLEYIPDQLCVELKSFKLYVWSFRDEGAFHEDVTNRMLNELVSSLPATFHAPACGIQCSYVAVFILTWSPSTANRWLAIPQPPVDTDRNISELNYIFQYLR